MDFQKYVDEMMKSARAKSLAESDQLTVGEIIAKLEPIIENQKKRMADGKREEATVVYDFEYLFPTRIDSWRGIYAELALNFVDNDRGGSNEKEMTVTEFLEMMKSVIGKEFTGYKGGEYTMSESTPVWVANYGNSGNTAVIDIVDYGYKVVIITGYRET